MKRTAGVGGNALEYELVRSSRHDVMIKVLPQGRTRVFAPTYMHLRDIDALVNMRAAEIRRMQDKLDLFQAEERSRHPLAPGSFVTVEGERYRLRLETAARTRMTIADGELLLATADIDNEERVRAVLRGQLSRLALNRIRERLDYYAPRIGVEFGRVTVRDQKSRWGSCSSRHNLNFNWKLILAPSEVLNYVVIHELCHLIEFNHSKRFWLLVGQQMPEYEAWKRWLKDHGGELGV